MKECINLTETSVAGELRCELIDTLGAIDREIRSRQENWQISFKKISSIEQQ